MVKPRMPEPKLKTSCAQMACRECDLILDVFWPDANGRTFTGRDPNVRRPTGVVPRHQLFGVIPDPVLADPGLVVYRCHKDCGRLVLLDVDDIWRQCAEGGRFAV